MSGSLWFHGLQHTIPPCASLSLGVCSNSCPLNQWCHPNILSSVVPFFSCPQSFPASRSFPMSQLFILSGRGIRASASASVLPMNIQGWLSKGSHRRIDCFDLLAVQGALKSLLQHHNSKASVLQHSTFFMVQLSHLYVTTGKTIAFTIWNFVSKVMSLLFNMLSSFVIAFLPWHKIFFQGLSSMSGSNCCFWTCTLVSHERGEMFWCPYLFKNFLQFVVIHTVKRFSIVSETEVDNKSIGTGKEVQN